ncbi:MAG: sigma-54-dependent Fis family transcriptional regulator [Verrucomicrobiales bacterium]|jgi:two-component system response regulator AtoC|nr:sigma-54-dependent Fis family transcriptional regulator [Verrucomicrobiales bacterium]MBP9223545.1 sigma-54-dependent Fis family transcriptional regulator [Verrucomicrobiales bacterium]HQZ27599.1 sigma-54 dependent transcriptional regulator [Verrucomicrobiales bacterium]
MDFLEHTILIVDDEKNTREGLRLSLEDEFDVYVAANITEAEEILKNESVDVMLTDLRLGGENGMDLITRALAKPKAPVCILMTAYGSVDVAVEAMKKGAYDYVSKPLNIDELEIVIKRAIRSRNVEEENVALKAQVTERYGLENIIGRSTVMQPFFETIRQVAPTRATVLIEGESGTGKELVGRAIHHLSGRPKSKLVTVHCAALSDQLLESELFGHERGSFTGALERRIGRFEEADGGTLFLDEIGEIDLSTQVKLLRAIGERTIERLGSNKPIKVDVRVVAATNRDLSEMVREGTFRDDLFFRLNVVSLKLPPLRQRKEDLILLVDAFLKEFTEENDKKPMELTSEAMQSLLEYDWPGNVRELRTVIEHGVVMSNTAKIGTKHLPHFLKNAPLLPPRHEIGSLSEAPAHRLPPDTPDDLNLSKMEERLIRLALERTSENRTEAAKLLGISRRTMQRKLKEMGLIEE